MLCWCNAAAVIAHSLGSAPQDLGSSKIRSAGIYPVVVSTAMLCYADKEIASVIACYTSRVEDVPSAGFEYTQKWMQRYALFICNFLLSLRFAFRQTACTDLHPLSTVNTTYSCCKLPQLFAVVCVMLSVT